MVNFYRVVFACFLATVCSLAGAVIQPVYEWTSGNYTGNQKFSSPGECLAANKAAWDAQYANYVSCRVWTDSGVTSGGDYTLRIGSGLSGCAGGGVQCVAPVGSQTCPIGAAMSGGSCQCLSPLVDIGGECKLPACPVGQHEEGGACVPDACQPNETRVNGVCVPEPPCPAGESRVNGKCVPFKCPSQGTVSDQWYDLDGPGKSSTCLFNGQEKTYCTMTVTPAVVAYKDGKPSYYGGYGVYTGGTCGPSEPGKPTPVDPDKPDGDPGDGTKPPGKGDPKPGDKPGPGGPGNNPTPPGSDGKCPDGTYKSGNSCYQKDPPKLPPDGDGKCPAGYIKADGQCLPIMPKPNDSDGDGKDDDEEDKDKSSFGGQCEAVQCDGDAIQCAMVRDQYKRSCQLMEKESAESQLYGTSKGKTGNQTGDLPGNETISLSGRISSVDALGAGNAGVSDLNISVMGQSITLPFSMINPYLEYLGYLLVAVSFLLAFRIVARG